MRAAVAGLVMILLGGCSATNSLDIDTYSDDALNKLTGEVSDDKTLVLRDKIVVAIIGHYAANRINKWSGDNEEDDATRVLQRLVKLEGKLADARTKSSGSGFHSYYRLKYQLEIAKTIRVAVQPAKRHYRSVIMSLLGGPSAIAAAKTIGQTLGALAKLGIYKKVLIKDVGGILKKIKNSGNPPTDTDWKSVDRFFFDACSRLTDLANSSQNPCTDPDA